MVLKTFNRVHKLVKYGNSLLPDIDVVSFDIFDTLLIRRIHDPDLIKLSVANHIATLAAGRGKNIDLQTILSCRQQHEDLSRQENVRMSNDSEAHYPTFMRNMLETLFEDKVDQIYEQTRAFELNIENAMLVPRRALMDWLHELHRLGKRIILISDIYLTTAELEPLLKYAGLSKYVDQLISSADKGLSKASGKGYELVRDQFSLDPKTWMHIGDHPLSDGIRPAQIGINALVLQDSEEQRRKSIMQLYFRYGQRTAFWKGRALQQLMAPLEAENQLRSYKYIAGYNFFGPLFGLFIHNIAEYCQNNTVDKIFFCSREGWIFKQVWEAVIPWLYPETLTPQIEYLYVSRKALAGASCGHNGLSRKNADVILASPHTKTFDDICTAFGFKPAPLLPLLERYKIDAATVLNSSCPGYDTANRKRFDELLEDASFQEEIKRQTKPQNDALQLYLEQAGYFENENIALVDIGWLGTIQHYLCSAISHRKNRPICHGLLFGATRTRDESSDKSVLTGLIYDSLAQNLPGSAILYAQDIFEEACRAPHPSLNAYRLKDDNEYELVFKENPAHAGQQEQEQDQSDHYADLRLGILDAAKRYGPSASIMNARPSEFRPWANYLLMSKLAFPKSREVGELRYKHHFDDFLGDNKPAQSHTPAFFIGNPWRLDGWRLVMNVPFLGALFNRHLKNIRESFGTDEL
jgi:FMN phosphatase YigB (HAD superfamily)